MNNIVTIAIINHIASADNRDGLRARDEDVLPDQVEAWREKLTPVRKILYGLASAYDATYCPTTKRHLSSAFFFAQSFGLPLPIPDSRINNVDYGIYKGRPLGDTPPGSEHIEKPYEGGTSWNHVAEQWKSFMEEVVRKHSGRAILLAGQSGAGPKMLAHFCEHIPLVDAVAHEPFRRVWRYYW